MPRLLSLLLVLAMLLAGVSPALAMQTTPQLGKSLYGDFVSSRNYPLNCLDPQGLTPSSRYIEWAKVRTRAGLNYYGGLGDESLNCCGDAYCSAMNIPDKILSIEESSKLMNQYGFRQVENPKIGDIAVFNGHKGTVVDFNIDGQPIIFGRDGVFGVYSGTPDSWMKGPNYPLEGYYRNPDLVPAENGNVIEYRAWSKVLDHGIPRTEAGIPVPATFEKGHPYPYRNPAGNGR